MIRRLLAVVLLSIGTVIFVAPGHAGAAGFQSAGWWARTATTNPAQEVPAPFPAPPPSTPGTLPNPSVPAGQLLVEGTPEGATAIAAIHWTLRDVETAPTATLPIGPGSTVNPTSIILACRAAVSWTEPEVRPGRWETKPVTDSRACLEGVIADDVSSVTFDLQPLVNGREVDIVLVPGRFANAPAEANASAFRWVFEDPAADALTVVTIDERPETAAPVVTSPPATFTPTTNPARTVAPPATSPRVQIAAPPVTSAPVIEAPPVETFVGAPALDATDFGNTVPRMPIATSLPSAETTSRFVGIVFLALGAAALAWTQIESGAAEPAMVGLGRFRRPDPRVPEFAGPVGSAGRFQLPAGWRREERPIGGLSRFARERTEPPVPII